MIKKRYFNHKTIMEVAQYLQPISPTTAEYQAHWWNDTLGMQIRTAQKQYIKNFKKQLSDCITKAEINKLISASPFPKWPLYITKHEYDKKKQIEMNYTFWVSGFGKLIRKTWSKMFQSFIFQLNSLD